MDYIMYYNEFELGSLKKKWFIICLDYIYNGQSLTP